MHSVFTLFTDMVLFSSALMRIKCVRSNHSPAHSHRSSTISTFRSEFIGCILATDLADHNDILTQFKTKLAGEGMDSYGLVDGWVDGGMGGWVCGTGRGSE